MLICKVHIKFIKMFLTQALDKEKIRKQKSSLLFLSYWLFPQIYISLTGLAQWDKRRSAKREAVGSNPGWSNTQGL